MVYNSDTKTQCSFFTPMRVTQQAKGFSMPEIIATIAIVAVLMAIAVPATLSQRKKGVEATQRSDLLSAVVGVETVLNSYKGAVPDAVTLTTDTTSGDWSLRLGETVLEKGRVSSGTVLTGATTGYPSNCDQPSLNSDQLANCGGYNKTASPPTNTAIWPNGTYCVQAVNTGSSRTTLSYSSNTQTVNETACSGNAPSGGVGTVTEGVTAGLPGMPTSLNVTVPQNTDNTVQINWVAPAAVSGVPTVSAYVIEIKGLSPIEVPSNQALPYAITNVPGGEKVVSVRAKNSNGVGPAATSNPITVTGSVNIQTDLNVINKFRAGVGADGLGTGSALLGNTEYNAVDARFNNATTNGYFVSTNMPLTQSYMPVVKISGSNTVSADVIDLEISWQNNIANATFSNASYVNNGSWDPGVVTLVKLSNGNAGVHLSKNGNAARFTVSVNPYNNAASPINPNHLTGWVVTQSGVPAGTSAPAVAARKIVTGMAPTNNPAFTGNVQVPNATQPGQATNLSQVQGLIGTAPTWAAFPFASSSGWESFGAAAGDTTYNNAQYAKLADGQVVLRGLVKKLPVNTTAETIGTLPSGFRPPLSTVYIQSSGSGGFARVDVLNTGVVRVVSYTSGGNSGYISLDGISFYTN